MKFFFALALLVAFVALSSAEGQVQHDKQKEKRVEPASNSSVTTVQTTTTTTTSVSGPSSQKSVPGVPESTAHNGNSTGTGRAQGAAGTVTGDSVNLKSFSAITLVSLALFASRLF